VKKGLGNLWPLEIGTNAIVQQALATLLRHCSFLTLFRLERFQYDVGERSLSRRLRRAPVATTYL